MTKTIAKQRFPKPKYAIGQRITHRGHPATVVGMTYLDPVAAFHYSGDQTPFWEFVLQRDRPLPGEDCPHFVIEVELE